MERARTTRSARVQIPRAKDKERGVPIPRQKAVGNILEDQMIQLLNLEPEIQLVHLVQLNEHLENFVTSWILMMHQNKTFEFKLLPSTFLKDISQDLESLIVAASLDNRNITCVGHRPEIPSK